MAGLTIASGGIALLVGGSIMGDLAPGLISSFFLYCGFFILCLGLFITIGELGNSSYKKFKSSQNNRKLKKKYKVGDVIYPAYNGTGVWYKRNRWDLVTEIDKKGYPTAKRFFHKFEIINFLHFLIDNKYLKLNKLKFEDRVKSSEKKGDLK